MSELFETVNDVIAERDSLATQLEQMRRERDEVRKSLRTVAHEIGVCHCWDFGCEPGPTDAIVDAVKRMRDSETREMEARVALDEARATNARLHRRAQGVDARSPDDADLIRRLRADVRGQAKHAGYVAGYVMRLRCALSDAQHARDADARAFNAALDREYARLLDAERERDEARAKLAARARRGEDGATVGRVRLAVPTGRQCRQRRGEARRART